MEYNVKSLEFCKGCNIDICASCAFVALKSHEYGSLLADNPPRFALWAFEDEQRFIRLLGDDVDPLKHGLYQANNVVMPFVEAQNGSPYHQSLSEEEAKILYIGNIVHDAHEGVWGDIPLSEKTADNNSQELEFNLMVVSELLRLSPDSPFMIAYRASIGDLEGWSLAGRAFKAIELCGYILTGLKAWEARNHADLDETEKARLEAMAKQVITMDVPLLEPYTGEFLFASELLRRNAKSIAEARGRPDEPHVRL